MSFLRMNRIAAILLTLSFAEALAAPTAIGCGFHSTMPETRLDGMYPGSLSVAVALRNAADKGVIDAAALDAPRNVATLFLYTIPRLKRFRDLLDASAAAAELPASFSLGYVESGLWTRFSQSDGKVEIKIHTDGPGGREAVVLTGEPVLTAIRAGTLSFDDALAQGLVVIEGNRSETAAIRHVFLAASPEPRISRR